ncbi:DASH family cryptochrome [Vibrio sp. SS-MA-C1-2]|uniref:DASH family cryptochrome n=1 Tax=Vibrio sp. SS-MA-C1-2 TaxID=2908646 RepID=UPI001F3EAB6C|nr:DASH family cryptochrome [Vibrio sp. SS-MA-C1-2]UJF17565.1 DASH family cryptochrome [Vibrio sp. SS-MA-C1-2]
MKVGIYWFSNDLRCHDNRLLNLATQTVDVLICIYCLPKITPFLKHFSQQMHFGAQKLRFQHQSLIQLQHDLQQRKQHLLIYQQTPSEVIASLIKELSVSDLFCHYHAGYDEQQQQLKVTTRYPSLTVHKYENSTILTESQLPYPLTEIPRTFTQFRKSIESIATLPPIKEQAIYPHYLIPKTISPLNLDEPTFIESSRQKKDQELYFQGGEQAALAHIEHYFSGSYASSYKETRNEFDGINNSTKFSLWLANGNLSVRLIKQRLEEYELQKGANQSTYWILFELLWREFFYWQALKNSQQLFLTPNSQRLKRLTPHQQLNLTAWQKGKTPSTLINACLNQLNETGYLSNRGRQLVGSYLIHELQIDWRFGAAYFETQLIDYDVASNWGNWQYLAGLGAAPNGSHQFDIIQQAQRYDPKGHFTKKWTI